MPPVYLSQLIASWWFWHTEDMVVTRGMTQYPLLMSSADTNQVEAHLYVGLIPLALLLGLLNHRIRHVLRTSPWKHWLIISTLAVVYSFGWLVPLFRHLPGFGFFMGPGRYTMITAMGLSLVAGLVLDAWCRKRSPVVRTSLAVIIAAITLFDVLKSSEPPVRDAQIVVPPPLKGLEDSWIARTLRIEDKTSPVRLLAPGPNIANLFGVSSAPQYLGLGPAEYFADDNRLQTMPGNPDEVFPSDELRSRLRRYAITHVLTTEPLKLPSDDLKLIQAAPDSFLNRVWGRGNSACFLYRLESARGRVTATPSEALTSLKYRLRTPEALELEVLLESPAVIEVCELMFEGWQVSIDGTDVSPETSSGFGRFVKVSQGHHIILWSYRPTSFRVGLGGTSLGIVLAACILWGNRRRR
jgi:hypothetical protein